MENIIKHYQTLLPAEQFVITGSLALFYMGLVEKKNVGDIDIILVNPTDESLNILQRLAKEQPAKTKASGIDAVIFQHENTKVDVFFSKERIQTSLKVGDFEISTADHIIKEKQKVGRIKDWIQLRKISRKLFIQEEFEKFLNKPEDDLPF